MSETQEAAPELSGNMFLFERPELLTKEQHGNLGVTPPEKPFAFCSKVRAIPLTVSEIPSAMKDYPIVFASMEEPLPLAVVGLVDDVNLFVDEDGKWQDMAYIPGYIRRYPFALANETGGDRLATVIDAAHPGISEGGEVKFFDENGEASESTKQVIDFCREYESDRRLTEHMMQQLKELELVQGQTAHYTPQGETEPKVFAQYFGIDEQRVKDLADDKYLQMRTTGLAGIVYAQLMSLTNWRLLMQRRMNRYGITEDKILEPIKLS